MSILSIRIYFGSPLDKDLLLVSFTPVRSPLEMDRGRNQRNQKKPSSVSFFRPDVVCSNFFFLKIKKKRKSVHFLCKIDFSGNLLNFCFVFF